MNCLELRRAALADPRHLPEDARSHAAACRDCADFLERALRLNAEVERALRLPVPESLRARILLRNSIGGRDPRLRYGLALAASLLVAVIAWQYRPAGAAPLRDAVVAYAEMNVTTAAAAATPSAAELERVYATAGITVSAAAGPIASARPCFIANAPGAHLVIATQKGAVTVLILPQSDVDAAVDFTVGPHLTGRLLPCPKGSIAIISEHADLIEEVHRRFDGAVGWI